jgi:hypothetical protein
VWTGHLSPGRGVVHSDQVWFTLNMSRDDISPAVARQLAQYLPNDDLANTPTEALIAGLKYAATTRASLQVVVGKTAAELHHRDPDTHTWQALARQAGMSYPTLRRWALPFRHDTDPTDTPTP